MSIWWSPWFSKSHPSSSWTSPSSSWKSQISRMMNRWKPRKLYLFLEYEGTLYRTAPKTIKLDNSRKRGRAARAVWTNYSIFYVRDVCWTLIYSWVLPLPTSTNFFQKKCKKAQKSGSEKGPKKGPGRCPCSPLIRVYACFFSGPKS